MGLWLLTAVWISLRLRAISMLWLCFDLWFCLCSFLVCFGCIWVGRGAGGGLMLVDCFVGWFGVLVGFGLC